MSSANSGYLTQDEHRRLVRRAEHRTLAGDVFVALISRDGTTKTERSQAEAAIRYADELLRQLDALEER